jgi:hypothetical protein
MSISPKENAWLQRIKMRSTPSRLRIHLILCYTEPKPNRFQTYRAPDTQQPNNHRTVFSTNSLSNRPTSRLNISTSFQQSSGRRSFVLKQVTTSSFAFSTAGSTCSSFFRASSFFFISTISFDTLLWLIFCLRCLSASAVDEVRASPIFSTSEGSSGAAGSSERVSETCESFAASWAWSFSSSDLTRAWIWSSRFFDRVESDCRVCYRQSPVSIAAAAGRES